MRSRQVKSAVALLTGAVGDAAERDDSKRSEAPAFRLSRRPSNGTRVRTLGSAPGVAVPTESGARRSRGRVGVFQLADQEL